jgi:hypothetical protein
VTGEAHETLRDELATINNPATRQRLLDTALRYADAQVAAYLDRIADVRKLHYRWDPGAGPDICPTCQTRWPCETRYAVDGTG